MVTLSGDSGACVTTLDGKIHSFVAGMIGDNYRYLSPAHFVLEQIKRNTGKKKVEFIRCVEKKGISHIMQVISRSVQGLFSRFSNRSVRQGNDISVAAQTTTASDSHAAACTVDSNNGNNGAAATDVIYNYNNDDEDLKVDDDIPLLQSTI